MASIIQENAGKEITLLINRNGAELTQNITPEASVESGKGAIGITPYQDQIVKKYGFLDAIVNGIKEAAKMIVEVVVLLFGFLYKLITGKIALGTAGKSLAGPPAPP